MVIIRLMGGLGNQLQQYALYEKMRLTGHDARLDTSWFHEGAQKDVLAKRKIELGLFPRIEYKEASKEEVSRLRGSDSRAAHIIRKITGSSALGSKHRFVESSQYHPEIFEMDEVYLEGFWACEKYYADILPQLREQISFSDTLEERQKLLKKLAKADKDTCIDAIESNETGNIGTQGYVSMHIRRGDYLDDANRAMFDGICTQKYYDAAEGYIRKHVENPQFFIFSDDTGYAREHYSGDEYTVVDVNHGEDSYKDIGLMSVCSHHICANSTFSFWGSRLDCSEDKIQIRPSIHKNSQVCEPDKMHEWWKGWTIITPQGDII